MRRLQILAGGSVSAVALYCCTSQYQFSVASCRPEAPSNRNKKKRLSYEDTWYSRKVSPKYASVVAEGRPSLASSTHADVCVVGGGLAGLNTALGLAERNPQLRVVLLESGRVGGSASGCNGGFVNTGFQEGPEALLEAFGSVDAARIQALSVASLDLIRERIRCYAIDCQLHEQGTLEVSMFDSEDEEEERRELDHLNQELGIVPPLELWGKGRVQQQLKTSDPLLTQSMHQVHNPLHHLLLTDKS